MASESSIDVKRQVDAVFSIVNSLRGTFARFHIPLLPLREQTKTIAYLSDKLPTIDRLISGKRKQLEILRVQRQSLIYEYVTGKRRVEGAGS